MLGGAPRKDLDRVTRYGDSLGLAFQITDDILDADEVSNGNPNQKRMANYLSVTGLARTKERVKD
jgi:geranylgeranyl pyrophosphate synthase